MANYAGPTFPDTDTPNIDKPMAQELDSPAGQPENPQPRHGPVFPLKPRPASTFTLLPTTLLHAGTVCPQKIRSLGIDTIFNAIFYEDSIKNKVYDC